MGKVVERAVRIGHEETWDNFQKEHPEIIVFKNEKGEAIDVLLSSKAELILAHKVNGTLEAICYIFNGKFYKFPTD